MWAITEDGDITFWDVDGNGKILRLQLHDGDIFTSAISPDGKWLATGGSDNTLCLCRIRELLRTGNVEQAYEKFKFDDWVTFAAFSPNSKMLALITFDHLHVLNLDTRKVVSIKHCCYDWFGNSISFSPDGQWLAATTNDGEEIVLFNTKTWKKVGIIKIEGVNKICAVAFSPANKNILAVGYGSGSMCLFDIRENKCYPVRVGQYNDYIHLAFSPNGQLLVANLEYFDGNYHLFAWNVKRVLENNVDSPPEKAEIFSMKASDGIGSIAFPARRNDIFAATMLNERACLFSVEWQEKA